MISIIMPVYNTVSFLEETVQSVLLQTYTDFELLLVDDGSTDGSGELCDMLARKDRRIRVIHKINGGVASARNAGLDAARGEYIGWVDSDDLVSPVMYETMVELAQKNRAGIVQCSHVRQPELLDMEKQIAPVEILGNIESLKRIYHSHYTNSLCLWSKIYRTELFQDLRFTEGTAFEDDELVPLLLERSSVNVFTETKLYCYVKRQSSIITAPKVKNIQALTTHLENRTLRFQELNEDLYGLGLEHFFRYLKGKVCEEAFRNTPVQTQAVQLLKKHRAAFRRISNRYDRVALLLLHCGRWGLAAVSKTEFEPVQSVLRRIRGNSGRE